MLEADLLPFSPAQTLEIDRQRCPALMAERNEHLDLMPLTASFVEAAGRSWRTELKGIEKGSGDRKGQGLKCVLLLSYPPSSDLSPPALHHLALDELTRAADCPPRRTFLYNMSKKHDQYGDVRVPLVLSLRFLGARALALATVLTRAQVTPPPPYSSRSTTSRTRTSSSGICSTASGWRRLTCGPLRPPCACLIGPLG